MVKQRVESLDLLKGESGVEVVAELSLNICNLNLIYLHSSK